MCDIERFENEGGMVLIDCGMCGDATLHYDEGLCFKCYIKRYPPHAGIDSDAQQ